MSVSGETKEELLKSAVTQNDNFDDGVVGHDFSLGHGAILELGSHFRAHWILEIFQRQSRHPI